MAYDIYERPGLPKDAPIFVFIHGGYWQESCRDGNTFVVQPLVDAGVRVFLIGYDLCPMVTLVELHDQVQRAVTNILTAADKEYESRTVVICGHSAGACLAIAMLNETRWRQLPSSHLIRAMFLLGGVFDLTEARYAAVVNKDNLLGITDDNVTELSPLLLDYSHLVDEDVRVAVIVAEFEAPGLMKQGHMMYAKMTSVGANAELIEAKSFDHFDLVTELRKSDCFITQSMVAKCVEEYR